MNCYISYILFPNVIIVTTTTRVATTTTTTIEVKMHLFLNNRLCRAQANGPLITFFFSCLPICFVNCHRFVVAVVLLQLVVVLSSFYCCCSVVVAIVLKLFCFVLVVMAGCGGCVIVIMLLLIFCWCCCNALGVVVFSLLNANKICKLKKYYRCTCGEYFSYKNANLRAENKFINNLKQNTCNFH